MKTYLFDFDGTLVDSMPAFETAMKKILDDHKVPYGDDFIKIITPLGVVETAKYFVSLGLTLEPEEIYKLMGENLIEAYTEHIPLKAYVAETLKALKERGASLSILTASPHVTLDPCLRRLGLFDVFENVWSSDDFGLDKDNPEIYKMAAERIGKKTGEILFLDDNINACRAAKQAGMQVCGVYDVTSEEYTEQMIEKTDFYIRDFKELLKI